MFLSFHPYDLRGGAVQAVYTPAGAATTITPAASCLRCRVCVSSRKAIFLAVTHRANPLPRKADPSIYLLPPDTSPGNSRALQHSVSCPPLLLMLVWGGELPSAVSGIHCTPITERDFPGEVHLSQDCCSHHPAERKDRGEWSQAAGTKGCRSSVARAGLRKMDLETAERSECHAPAPGTDPGTVSPVGPERGPASSASHKHGAAPPGPRAGIHVAAWQVLRPTGSPQRPTERTQVRRSRAPAPPPGGAGATVPARPRARTQAARAGGTRRAPSQRCHSTPAAPAGSTSARAAGPGAGI